MTDRPIIGFRVWKLTYTRELRGLSQPTVWPAQTAATAECLAWPRWPRCHPLPGADHTCGIYAYYQPRRLTTCPVVMGGVVKAWGRVIRHEAAFRAEHARVVCLVEPDAEPYSGEPIPASVRAEVAERYDVPVLPLAEAVKYARWWGEIIDTGRLAA